jgi:AP2-associated kinase
MLREHGSQRPTVFEILNLVHRTRGTKSKFTYNVPSRSQLVPQLPTNRTPSMSAALDGLVSYRSSTSSVPQVQMPPSANPEKNAGVQAREKVLEAIAPLRRGRPAISLHHATTGPSSPTQEKIEHKPTELEFKDAEDQSWKAARGTVRGHRSGLASPTAWPPPAASIDDAWSVSRGSGADTDKAKNRDRRKTVQGSLSLLSGFGDSFGGGLDLLSTATAATSTSNSPWLTPQLSAKPVAAPQRPLETTSRIRPPSKPKDAFEGLVFLSDRMPAPTLGEAQIAKNGTSPGATGAEFSSANLTVPGRGTSYSSATNTPRPSPSPRSSPQTLFPAAPIPTPWRPSPSPQAAASAPKADLTVEQRFPALEDLDGTLLSSTAGPPPPTSKLPSLHAKTSSLNTPALPPQPLTSAFASTGNQRSGSKFVQTLSRGGGIHSEQPTGAAPLESHNERTPKHERTGSHLSTASPSRIPRLPSRAMPPRRQPSLNVRAPSVDREAKPKEPPSPAQIMGRPEPQDWLTGPEVDSVSGVITKAVLKESPGKRSSVIVERAPEIPSPQEAVAISEKRVSPPPSPTPASRTTPSWIMTMKQTNTETGSGRQLIQPKPGPAPAPADSWLPTHKRRDTTSTTGSDEGPEEATGYGRSRLSSSRLPSRVEAKETGGVSAGGRRRSVSKSRQGSVHELVDLWGGKDGRTKSSGGDSGPSAGSKPVISQEPEDINSSSKSLLFPPTGQLSKPRSASPSLISPSISTSSSRHEPSSPTRTSPRHRKRSTNGHDAAPLPSASIGTPTSRPRPQSMFLNSPTTAAVKFPMPSPIDNSSSSSTNASLDVPSPDTRTPRTMRRTSISNMVQRYEAMGGSAAASPISRQPNSSPGVSVTRSATTRVSSSSRRSQFGAVGLPGLATDALKKPSTGIGASDSRPRPEHASPVGLPGLAMERKASYGGRRSPIKFDAAGGSGSGGIGGLDAPVNPIPKRSFSPVPPPAANDEVQAPSPERPYQGVGRLIDEWQRKTADTEAPRSPVSRRRGGGGAGTGAAVSPRRAGVIAGRGPHD